MLQIATLVLLSLFDNLLQGQTNGGSEKRSRGNVNCRCKRKNEKRCQKQRRLREVLESKKDDSRRGLEGFSIMVSGPQ
jgi:hypothetical protein